MLCHVLRTHQEGSAAQLLAEHYSPQLLLSVALPQLISSYRHVLLSLLQKDLQTHVQTQVFNMVTA